MEKTLEQTSNDCIKVVLYGPESTGKTTLAKDLATHFKTLWVPEYMREFLLKKWDYRKEKISKEDLLPIAKGQMKLENSISAKANKVVFCDTNLLEIKVYSEYYYHGFCPSEIKKAALENHYHHYLLTGIDVPWKADILRDRPNDREEIFSIFEAQLKQENLPYHLIKGTQQQRLQTAVEIVNHIVKQSP